jgi:hypothetical protein
MDAIITSPAITPVGLLITIVVLAEVFVFDVLAPRCAICATTMLAPSNNTKSNIAFEIIAGKKE